MVRIERLADFQWRFLRGNCRSRSALIRSQSPVPGTASYDTVTRRVTINPPFLVVADGSELSFLEFQLVRCFLPLNFRRLRYGTMEGVPEDSIVVQPQRNEPPISLRTAPIQVRRRRATISARPASPPPTATPIIPDSPRTTFETPIARTATSEGIPQSTSFPRVTRRRGATITERLFSGDVYESIGEDSGRTTRARAGTVVDSNFRGRIGSVSSANSGGLRTRLGLGSASGSIAGSDLHADDEIDLVSRNFTFERLERNA